jgi:hypothetical protein
MIGLDTQIFAALAFAVRCSEPLAIVANQDARALRLIGIQGDDDVC